MMIQWLKKLFPFRKTPRLIQMEASECGAAALGIILGSFGKFVPLETLRIACGVSRDGVSFDDIELAAQHFGLESEVFEAEFEDLKETKLPAILFWDYNHFVVLEEFREKKVYINDPAMGHRILTMQELAKSYSGLLMEFSPGPSFQASGRPDTFIQRVKEKIAPFKHSLSYLFWVQISLALLGLAIPVFAQVFIDQFFGNIIPDWEAKFLLLFLGIVLLTGIMTWTQQFFLKFFQVRLNIRLSSEFLWRILHLPVLFFKQRYGSELVNRMNLNSQVGEILTQDFILNALNFLLLSSYWVIMLFYSIPITLIAAGVAAYNMILVWYIGKVRSNSYAKLQQSEAKTVGVSFDALEHMETMKGNANESFFFSRIANAYTENINNVQEISKKDIWLSTLSRFSEQISTVAILGFGSYAIISGSLTVGKLIALQILYRNFLSPVSQLIRFSTEIQSVEVDLTRLDDVLKSKPDPFLKPRKPTAISEPIKGDVQFKDVSFGYKMLQPPIIQKLNVHLKQGEMIGLTGPIGSGKSTIAKLATCLFQPRKGHIHFDGKSYEEYTLLSLSKSFGIVNQIVELFPGTIRENLTLWSSAEIKEEKIMQAAKRACIHEDIMHLPERYSTLVQEDGRNFSAGQRQRLEIARILLRHPSLLILDEATNALDAETEVKILENIRSLNITTLLISHRLSTFKNCDRILVLEQGKIIQEGSHIALSKEEGLYKKLLEFEIKKKI